MKLRKRELPTVEFSRDLPPHLGDRENPTKFILRGRPAGLINPQHTAALNELSMAAEVRAREADRIEGDEAQVAAERRGVREMNARRLMALWDHCVTEWECGIFDEETGEPCETTGDKGRANFEEAILAEGEPELTQAILDAETAFLKAGADQIKADEDTEKN